MGCGNSAPVNQPSNGTKPQPAQQSQPTNNSSAKKNEANPFSEEEMRNLKQRFNALAKMDKDDGLIDKGEFLSILHFEDSLFVDRIFKLFDVDDSGAISVDEFIKAMGILGQSGPINEKIKLSFRMWDLNSDGLIAKTELSQLMKSSLEASSILISEGQMNKLIDATFALADCDANGSITLAEYEKLVQMFPNMISNMTLDISGKMEEKA